MGSKCIREAILERSGLGAFITQYGSTVYMGIAQVTRHQPCTYENLSFHLNYAFHFTFEEFSVKNR